MLKGRELIGYILNEMEGSDKFVNLMTIAEEVVKIDEITKSAISLINPINQFAFVEDLILGVPDYEEKLKEFMKSYYIPLPIRWAWKHYHINQEGDKQLMDEDSMFDGTHACYRSMYKSVMHALSNLVDFCKDDEFKVSKTEYSIKIEAFGCIEDFTMFEEI